MSVALEGPVPERLAEKHLAHRILVSMAFAVPILAVFFALLVGAAMMLAGQAVVIPTVMGAGIGVLAGMFFGMWAGFVASVAELDREDLGQHRDERESS